ncbi:aldolase/citrate lyase family protein [Tenacibaculum aquimarinum]|uniref:aldolase/citrate lyase family protein n=1 Tax=Tenacibaculum aquimarinum TaxID=2910675 RepID=UPI001F0A8B3E|nr:aldolase/citrate lyase family protein [Tenacibaculum aquimarinum]MCH3884616.1 aldolase/citrate lyase family protein [Tenacibaculum aquimarinum]
MKKYFFVPGNKLHKINSILKLNVSDIIIDLEDAVKFSEREDIISNLNKQPEYKKHFIRVPLYDIENKLNFSMFESLITFGFTKFVFPKIESKSDFELIIDNVKSENLKIILLIETPRLFLEAKELLLENQKYFVGLAIGSHDLMSVIGGEHSLKNLEVFRQNILILARMISIEAIDIASMELSNESEVEKEIIDGFKKGYDGKFYIHPWQLNVEKRLTLYSKKEYNWAIKIKNELEKVSSEKEFAPVVIDGEIIERPHLNKVKKIIEYYETK